MTNEITESAFIKLMADDELLGRVKELEKENTDLKNKISILHSQASNAGEWDEHQFGVIEELQKQLDDALHDKFEAQEKWVELDQKNAALYNALNTAAYSLFQVKRMGVSDQVHDFASDAHIKACKAMSAIGDSK